MGLHRSVFCHLLARNGKSLHLPPTVLKDRFTFYLRSFQYRIYVCIALDLKKSEPLL